MADNTISTGALSFLSSQEKFKDEPKSNELGQAAFLELMIAQMNHQNPLEPQSNSEFVAQLAQFSSVEGLEKLNNNVESLVGSYQSNQALQASSLVGRNVTVRTDHASLTEGGSVSGSINVPYESGKVTLNIYTESGELVSTEELGAMSSGISEFTWDGNNDDDEALRSGRYSMEVIATYGDETLQLETEIQANVDSVTVGSNGTLTLNIDGIGPVSLSDVRNII